MACGAASTGLGELLGVLFTALARATERRVGVFKAQALANMAWGFATVGKTDAVMFMALAAAAERCIFEFKP